MSGKSKEEIAFDLVAKLKGVGVWGENNMQQILDMYAECLEATSGLREINGKTPSALKLSGQSASTIAPPQAAAPRQAISPQQAPVQPHVQAPPAQQPQVRQQQQMVQQAYQQQAPVAR